jgi:hypothetical protein
MSGYHQGALLDAGQGDGQLQAIENGAVQKLRGTPIWLELLRFDGEMSYAYSSNLLFWSGLREGLQSSE